MAKKTIWKAMALTIYGEGTTTIENGIQTYTAPPKKWKVLKTDTDFVRLDDWLTDYINRTGYYYGDFKITK